MAGTIWAVGPAIGPRSATRPLGREQCLWMAGVPVYVFMKWRGGGQRRPTATKSSRRHPTASRRSA
jgi:hypothetical protein